MAQQEPDITAGWEKLLGSSVVAGDRVAETPFTGVTHLVVSNPDEGRTGSKFLLLGDTGRLVRLGDYYWRKSLPQFSWTAVTQRDIDAVVELAADGSGYLGLPLRDVDVDIRPWKKELDRRLVKDVERHCTEMLAELGVTLTKD